jgi:hypothetical protein
MAKKCSAREERLDEHVSVPLKAKISYSSSSPLFFRTRSKKEKYVD